MSAGCALVEFLRVGRPARVPLRSCCVAALLAGTGDCRRRAVVERPRPSAERVGS